MPILELIVFIVAYTVGVITIFLELVCYKKKIEYPETIFFTGSFLLLIISISINSFINLIKTDTGNHTNIFVLISIILLSLTTPLNIFVERQVKISPFIKKLLFMLSGILLIMVIGNTMLNLAVVETIVSVALVISIVTSMLMIQLTKPAQRIKHREKIERKLSIVVLIIIPISIMIEFFSDKIQFLSFANNESSITVPVIFILLASSKLLDDLIRLSLFKTDNTVKQQNILNYNLTQREFEVANLLIKGYSYTKISEVLFISLPTVKTHVSNIYKKVKVNNKMELLNAITN